MSKAPGYLGVTECLQSPHHPSQAFLLFLSPAFVEQVREGSGQSELELELDKIVGSGRSVPLYYLLVLVLHVCVDVFFLFRFACYVQEG